LSPVDDYGSPRDGATDGEPVVMAAADEDRQPGASAPSSDQWHDAITGLPRPPAFLARLEHALARMNTQARRVAVVLLEVTDFGSFERDLGPAAGDELLRTMAERLHAEVPDPDLLTRIRGAEFAIVFPDLGPEISAEDLATRLLERVSEPYLIGNRVLSCKVIAAVRLAGDRSESGPHLLERAAVALGRARVRNGQGLCGQGGGRAASVRSSGALRGRPPTRPE
jgi:diguanylate cyclase (GGDEF)-like protein